MITIYRRYIARSWTNDEFLMNLGEPHHDSHFASATWIFWAGPGSVCAESEIDGAGGTIDFPQPEGRLLYLSLGIASYDLYRFFSHSYSFSYTEGADGARNIP
jgi:hypothetical protein